MYTLITKTSPDIQKSSLKYITSEINSDMYDVMKNTELKESDRIDRLLLSALCNENGIRIFDNNNEMHLNIVRSFTLELKTKLLIRAKECMMPDKKKELEIRS